MKYYYLLALLFSPLAFCEIKTFDCKYYKYSDEEGVHKVENDFNISFVVDRESEKYYIVGNQGSSHVVKFETQDKISFVEVTESGNIMSTTIDSKFNSVHSRNTVIFGELLPSQYYGKCVIK